jgi:hypothetical protein
VVFEEALEEQELGQQVLALGRFVDDGHMPERCVTALGSPFGAEHGDETRLEVGRAALPAAHGLGDLGAAGALGAAEDGVEQAAAGVGVDLDEPGPSAARWKS